MASTEIKPFEEQYDADTLAALPEALRDQLRADYEAMRAESKNTGRAKRAPGTPREKADELTLAARAFDPNNSKGEYAVVGRNKHAVAYTNASPELIAILANGLEDMPGVKVDRKVFAGFAPATVQGVLWFYNAPGVTELHNDEKATIAAAKEAAEAKAGKTATKTEESSDSE